MFPPNFVIPDRIGIHLDIGSKKRLLEVLGQMLASSIPSLTPESVFERLLERERLGSTGLGHGIALPHARMPQVKQAVGAFIQLEQGVDFDAVDDQRVDLAFALLVPEAATEDHLQLLSQLAVMFSNEDVPTVLRNAATAEQVFEHFQQWQHLP